MRFQGSDQERQYNQIWNKEVVTSYRKLQKHTNLALYFYSQDSTTIKSLINKYQQGVAYLLNNIRPDDFEDRGYVLAYIKAINTTTAKDYLKCPVLGIEVEQFSSSEISKLKRDSRALLKSASPWDPAFGEANDIPSLLDSLESYCI